MTLQEIEQEAGKLLRQCRKLKAQIEGLVAEFEADMKPLRENYRAKYTRLNQLAKELKKEVTQIEEA